MLPLLLCLCWYFYSALSVIACVHAPLGALVITGSDPPFSEYYWNDRHEEIKTYCEKDIKATANVILKMSGMPICQ